jgi:hypothetical protein
MPQEKDRFDTALQPEFQAVLRVFQEYLMTPGKMLCFYGHDLDRFRKSLAALSSTGMLKAEAFSGGYSLTVKGYAAMQQL